MNVSINGVGVDVICSTPAAVSEGANASGLRFSCPNHGSCIGTLAAIGAGVGVIVSSKLGASASILHSAASSADAASVAAVASPAKLACICICPVASIATIPAAFKLMFVAA